MASLLLCSSFSLLLVWVGEKMEEKRKKEILENIKHILNSRGLVKVHECYTPDFNNMIAPPHRYEYKIVLEYFEELSERKEGND